MQRRSPRPRSHAPCGVSQPHGLSHSLRRAPVLVGALLVGALLPAALHAQDPTPWSAQVEVGGTFSFGNSPQSQFTTRAEIVGEGPVLVSNTRLDYSYGVSEDATGALLINRRSWVVTQAVDYVAAERWKPFLTGKAEGAFERRIDLRVDAGAGVKYDVQRSETNRVEFSVALLGERTWQRVSPSVSDAQPTLARFSSTLRVRRGLFGDRVAADLQQNYRPALKDFSDFTFGSLNTFSLGLTETVAFRTSLKVDHDAGAKDRGAITNTDTQVQLSIVVDL